MRKLIYLGIALCLSIFAVGCFATDEPLGPDVPNVGGITFSQEQINASSAGGVYSVDILLPTDEIAQSWTAEWISSTTLTLGFDNDVYSGTFQIEVLPNNTGNIREGKITLFSEDYNLSATLTVIQEAQHYPFEITISTEDSRTQLGEKTDGNYPLYWLPEDKIMCNGQTSSCTVINDDLAKIATFKFSNTAIPPYNIVYPAPSNGEVATTEGCYPIVFPAKQNYVINSFDNGAAPMYGYTYETNTSLLHLSGVIRIAINGDATLSHMIITAETGYISGVFDLDCQTGHFTPQEGNVSNQIEYTFGKGLQLESIDTPMYITIPAGDYGTISISIYATDGSSKTVKFDSSNKPITAGTIRVFSSFTFSPNQM